LPDNICPSGISAAKSSGDHTPLGGFVLTLDTTDDRAQFERNAILDKALAPMDRNYSAAINHGKVGSGPSIATI
jgi:hypothetical protein